MLAGLPFRAPNRASREETAEGAEARRAAARGSDRPSRDLRDRYWTNSGCVEG